MKFLLFPLAILFVCFSCKPSPRKAAAYNDSIVAQIKQVTAADDDFWRSVSDTGGNAMAVKAEALARQISASSTALESLEKIDAQDTLKKAALRFLDTMKNLVIGDYDEIIKIAKNRERTEEEAAKANRLVEEARMKRKNAGDRLTAVQNSFAAEYNISIGHK